MRKFQVRDCDRSGDGSFSYVDVDDSTSDEKIVETVVTKTNEYYQAKSLSLGDKLSILSGNAPMIRKTLKVVEIKHNEKERRWYATRGGLKFTLIFSNFRGNYVFGKFQ